MTLNCLALNPLNGLAPRCIEVVDGSNVKAEVASKAMGESQPDCTKDSNPPADIIKPFASRARRTDSKCPLRWNGARRALPVFFSAMPDAPCRGGIVLANISLFEDFQIIRSMSQRGRIRTSSQQKAMLETACYLQRVKVAARSWLGMLLIA